MLTNPAFIELVEDCRRDMAALRVYNLGRLGLTQQQDDRGVAGAESVLDGLE